MRAPPTLWTIHHNGAESSILLGKTPHASADRVGVTLRFQRGTAIFRI
jgi:hypothetical protein